MAAFGLYTHIQANRRRSVALVVGLFVLVYVLTFAFALLFRAFDLGPSVPGGAVQDYLGAAARDLLWLSPVVTAATALWVWAASRFHQGLIDAVTRSEGVARETDPRLYNLLENLCISRGVPMPRLKIMDTDRLNAFATGLNEKQYAITVTRGLLAALDDAELEAVLGHELTHIRNEDVRMMVTAVVIAGVISFFGELVFRWIDVLPRWGGSSSSRASSSSERRRRLRRYPDRAGADRARLGTLAGDPLRAIAVARVPRRRRLGRADQEPRRDDLGLDEDLRQGRARGRAVGPHGDVRRHPALGLRRSLRHAPADRGTHRRARPLCRRPPASAAAGTAGGDRKPDAAEPLGPPGRRLNGDQRAGIAVSITFAHSETP